MKKLMILIIATLTTSVAEARITDADIDRINAEARANLLRTMPNALNPEIARADIEKKWQLYNQPPHEDGSSGELEARTATNGYVILNKSQGLIKQWGRINLPGNSLGQHRVSFSKRMSSVFAITVSSSDPYTSSSCRGCTIETGARVKSYNNSGFDITNGFVGDSKGGVFAVTLYWEATGKL